MSQSLQERYNYHPRPDDPWWRRGIRSVDRRLGSLLQNVDFAGRTVLDLGCSGGYFSFSIAKQAARVIGVDGDAELIARNRAVARELGYHNVSFEHATLTADSVAALPAADVVLFLSVFHHMLTVSVAYDWNADYERSDPFATLAAIREKAGVFVFEMGSPNEGYEWCARMPPMQPSVDQWIRERVFTSAFPRVSMISAPAYGGLDGKLRRLMAQWNTGVSLADRIKNRVFAVDPRDRRDIYIGRKR